MKLVIKNGLIIKNSRTVEKGTLVVEDGIIKDIVDNVPDDMDAQIIDATNKVVAPGLINAHMHSYANYYKTARDNLPLEEMMLYIMAEGSCLNPEDVYFNTMLGAIEMIRNGITGCLDQLAQQTEGLNSAIKAYEDIGMRATMAPMYTDVGYYQSIPVNAALLTEKQHAVVAVNGDNLINMNVAFLKEWHNKHDRLKVGFGPSGPQRSTEYFFKRNMELASEYDTVLHTHGLETRTQKNTAHFMYGKSMMRYLDDIGCLNERLTIAHGVWVAQEDMKMLADRGVKVAHCPVCNLYLGSGIANVNAFRAAGMKIGLGTDGPNGGCNQNMHETMKFAGMLHRATELDSSKWLTAAEVFDYATVTNAEIIGMKGQVGTLDVGKRADIVIYNPESSPALQPLSDPVMQIAFGEKGQGVESVIIQGQPVLLDGEFVTIDEYAVRKEIIHHGELVQARLEACRAELDRNVAELVSILPRDF